MLDVPGQALLAGWRGYFYRCSACLSRAEPDSGDRTNITILIHRYRVFGRSTSVKISAESLRVSAERCRVAMRASDIVEHDQH